MSMPCEAFIIQSPLFPAEPLQHNTRTSCFANKPDIAFVWLFRMGFSFVKKIRNLIHSVGFWGGMATKTKWTKCLHLG